jgi:hypothetical protein
MVVGASSPCGQTNTAPPATMRVIPRTRRRSAFSRNTIHAMSEVNTASRFSSRDALEPEVWVSPYINKTGPSRPPATIAHRNHRQSPAGIRGAPRRRSRARRIVHRPIPLPRYRNPANSSGGMSTLRIFANGVLAPNNKAENKAATMEALELVTTVGSMCR